MTTGGNIRVAIVGGTSLKGRELADLLNERSFPAQDVRLLDDDETLGQLEAVGDEVTFVQAVTREQFENVDISFFATQEKFTSANWQMARDAGSAIVDLSYGLEAVPGAVVRAPWVERELGQPAVFDLQPAPVIAAHPAAIVLALLVLRAQQAGAVRTAAATVMQPASEHGRRGMDELHEQTINLLSFKELPKKVFDQQVAFNVLASYGEESQPALDTIEQRIRRHFQLLTDSRVPATAIMLVQTPSFHGHAFAIYVELEQPVTLGAFAAALAGEHVEITTQSDESPSNVNAAGQNNILVSVRPDAQRTNGFWIWAATDNLRLQALNAVECAEAIAATRPKGKVQ